MSDENPMIPDPPEVADLIVKLESNLPVCRVCLNISLQYIEFDSPLCLVNDCEITYSEGFNIIAPPATDIPFEFPATFCSSCGNDLLKAFLFRKRIENANVILGNLWSNDERLPSDEEDFIKREEFGQTESPKEEHIENDCVKLEELVELNVEKYTTTQQKKKSRRKKADVTNWPASPQNSLYTDSDSDWSLDIDSQDDRRSTEQAIWMCNDCKEVCMSRGILRIHRKLHQLKSLSELSCRKCNKSFQTATEFESHLLFHKFSELMTVEPGKMFYRCKLCKRKYRSTIDFIDHLNIHKGKKPYTCKICADTFHTKYLLRLHTFRSHRNVQRKARIFLKKSRVELKEKCPHCCKLVRKSFMEIHKELHFGPRSATCEQCGKEFRSQRSLKTHKLVHTQSGEFPCQICKKICQTQYALKSHIKFKHVKVKSRPERKELKYQCEDCGMVFQYLSRLRIHQRRHEADSAYKCPHCNRKYLRKDQFKIHLRYHTNDLPHKCDRCDKSYGTRNNLTDHVKSVHENVTYSCDRCSQKFKSGTGLKKHKFLHTGYPYVCPICSHGQPFRSGMKSHLLRVHKDTFTEEEFDKTFPVLVQKSGFRRPKAS